ncbi:hypothetical protein DPMN_064473 [Dreissena polymorpha]|uniref:Uncharacterized protein n=1 Tax=Dreissena polymorpha TaxID=45954 RepID=A0A9D4CDW0_DREPO|nr:hypothetical protein DPMN_064473 [Dreissena polymorpha]
MILKGMKRLQSSSSASKDMNRKQAKNIEHDHVRCQGNRFMVLELTLGKRLNDEDCQVLKSRRILREEPKSRQQQRKKLRLNHDKTAGKRCQRARSSCTWNKRKQYLLQKGKEDRPTSRLHIPTVEENEHLLECDVFNGSVTTSSEARTIFHPYVHVVYKNKILFQPDQSQSERIENTLNEMCYLTVDHADNLTTRKENIACDKKSGMDLFTNDECGLFPMSSLTRETLLSDEFDAFLFHIE